MDRLACVDVAAFPLQLLLGDHPDWAAQPAAVVEDDRPQSRVLFVNAQARRLGVRTGQRYAAALSFARELRAGVVSSVRIERGIRALADRLRRYSPHVEPSTEVPGVFWLDASGLGRLYPSLETWAGLIRGDLRQEAMIATVVVGFSRFGTYALALSQRDTLVCADVDDERTRVERVPLARLHIDPAARDRLLALGIDTVGGFLRLPAGSLRLRFGAEVEALHRLAAGTRWAPLVPAPPDVCHQRIVEFDTAEGNVERLLFVIKSRLDGLATAVARQGHAIVEVVLWMKLDDRSERSESVTPAASTLDVTQLLSLVRLRLDAVPLSTGPFRSESRGVVTLRLSVNTCPASSDQRALLPAQARRDGTAADRALARLRAECGDQRIVRAAIRDVHLPSARFAWEPLARVPAHTSPRLVTLRPLVRRIFTKPAPMPSRWQAAMSSSTVARASDGALLRRGPYVIAGGWWGGGVRRDYYYLQTPEGDLLWVYYDHRRRQFFLQGQVE